MNLIHELTIPYEGIVDTKRSGKVVAFEFEGSTLRRRVVLQRVLAGRLSETERQAVRDELAPHARPRSFVLSYFFAGGSLLDHAMVQVLEFYVPGHPTQVIWGIGPTRTRRTHYVDPFRRCSHCAVASLGYPFSVPFRGTTTTDPLTALKASAFRAYAFRHVIDVERLGAAAPDPDPFVRVLEASDADARHTRLRKALANNTALKARASRYVRLLAEGAITTPRVLDDVLVEAVLSAGLVQDFVAALDFMPLLEIGDADLLARFARTLLEAHGLNGLNRFTDRLIATGYDPEEVYGVQITDEALSLLFADYGSGLPLRPLPGRLQATYLIRAARAYVARTPVPELRTYWSLQAIEATVQAASCMNKPLELRDLGDEHSERIWKLSPVILQTLGERIAAGQVLHRGRGLSRGNFQLYDFAQTVAKWMPDPAPLHKALQAA